MDVIFLCSSLCRVESVSHLVTEVKILIETFTQENVFPSLDTINSLLYCCVFISIVSLCYLPAVRRTQPITICTKFLQPPKSTFYNGHIVNILADLQTSENMELRKKSKCQNPKDQTIF